MKVVYTYTEGTEPLYINGSSGVQRVLIVFKDEGKTFVYYCDDYTRKMYLNEILSTRLAIGFSLDNFKKIEDEEQFDRYIDYIQNNYNYSGSHIHEVVDGHDQGGAIVDTRGL